MAGSPTSFSSVQMVLERGPVIFDRGIVLADQGTDVGPTLGEHGDDLRRRAGCRPLGRFERDRERRDRLVVGERGGGLFGGQSAVAERALPRLALPEVAGELAVLALQVVGVDLLQRPTDLDVDLLTAPQQQRARGGLVDQRLGEGVPALGDHGLLAQQAGPERLAQVPIELGSAVGDAPQHPLGDLAADDRGELERPADAGRQPIDPGHHGRQERVRDLDLGDVACPRPSGRRRSAARRCRSAPAAPPR